MIRVAFHLCDVKASDSADRLYQLDEAALGASGRIFVNQVVAGSLIDLLLSDFEFRLGLLIIAILHRFTDSTNLRPHVTLGGTIVKSTLFVLAKTLLSTGSVWHVSVGRSRASIAGWEVVLDFFRAA